MYKYFKFLPLFFFTHQAQATTYPLQVDFSGTFLSAPVNTVDLDTKIFIRQFNFDFLAGDYGSRGPSGSGKDNGRVELEYEDNVTASVSFNGQTYNVDQVELSFFDDFKRLEEQDDIDEHGYNNEFSPDVYDALFLDGYLSTNQEEHFDLTNGLEFSIYLIKTNSPLTI